ncbi:MAG: tRNA guanosine(34) transglycosylase Tgt [bacterium]|nr:tRNA guanosine(34) transglycosylase Tgt [bacterium]
MKTAHGRLPLPAFLPDGTRGVVRTLDAEDLSRCGVSGLMVNALHLSTHPGTSLVKSVGGIHAFMGWDGPVMSDSGGFQVYSLIAENPKSGRISKDGFLYRMGQKKQVLTPEKCIQKQFQIGADVLFCLDHCTHPDEEEEVQDASVAHTIDWARRCKTAFEQHLDRREGDGPRPLLFAVVQGGRSPALRKRCAESLLEIGFDGYGYGGWPVDSDGGLVDEVGLVAELIPDGVPRHALGIGKPENLVRGFQLGYDTFDCTIPTRDARHKRLYVFNDVLGGDLGPDFYRYLYIDDERYARDRAPLDETCDCLCCGRYSRAYLHHLFQVNDGLAFRLATVHNLRFYARLMAHLVGRAEAG